MRQAIETKYLGPTNFRGSRVKATSGSGLTLTVEWNHEFNSDVNHRDAAVALCKKLGWPIDLIGGSTVKGFCFVQREEK